MTLALDNISGATYFEVLAVNPKQNKLSVSLMPLEMRWKTIEYTAKLADIFSRSRFDMVQ